MENEAPLFQDDTERKNRVISGISTTVIIAIILLLSILLGLWERTELYSSGGITMAGYEITGQGQLTTTAETSPTEANTPDATEPVVDPVTSVNDVNAIPVAQEEPTPKPTPKPDNDPKPKPPAEPEKPKINEAHTLQGNVSNTNNNSQGTTTLNENVMGTERGDGDQLEGNLEGSVGVGPKLIGFGSRGWANKPTIPCNFQVEGKLIFDILVDGSGRIVEATLARESEVTDGAAYECARNDLLRNGSLQAMSGAARTKGKVVCNLNLY